MFSLNSLCMQHVSLAVGGGQVGQRWSHGCQGEMKLYCAAGEGHGGAAGTSRWTNEGGAPQCCCASSSLWRQPTAVMRAAPLPLPSSDSRKLTSHFGASSFTVCWKIREKLGGRKIGWLGKKDVIKLKEFLWILLSEVVLI